MFLDTKGSYVIWANLCWRIISKTMKQNPSMITIFFFDSAQFTHYLKTFFSVSDSDIKLCIHTKNEGVWFWKCQILGQLSQFLRSYDIRSACYTLGTFIMGIENACWWGPLSWLYTPTPYSCYVCLEMHPVSEISITSERFFFSKKRKFFVFWYELAIQKQH